MKPSREARLKEIYTGYGLCRYHFIESLILAQDERWRRA